MEGIHLHRGAYETVNRAFLVAVDYLHRRQRANNQTLPQGQRPRARETPSTQQTNFRTTRFEVSSFFFFPGLFRGLRRNRILSRSAEPAVRTGEEVYPNCLRGIQKLFGGGPADQAGENQFQKFPSPDQKSK